MATGIGGSKAVRDFVRDAIKNGFVLVRCRKHIILRNHRGTLTIAASTSDHRGLENARHDMKKLID